MAKLSLLQFLREQWKTIPRPTIDAHGKTIVVTGATSGLGLEPAKQLQKLSPQKLILTSRRTAKVEDVDKCDLELIEAHRRVAIKVLVELDLAVLSSVSAFVGHLGESKIDCLLANAAIATRQYTTTQGGLGSIILLLPNLIKAANLNAPLRIIIVSNDAHYQLTSIDHFRNSHSTLEALNDKEACTTRFLFITSVNPGFCKSKLTRESESQFPGSILIPALKTAIARSTKTAPSVLVHALTDGDERKMHGHFVSSCQGYRGD
ncbi:short-chain dehydrogenase [Lentinula aciculospora]|uniref:Short-chain dehydrogenase n=1 Tax=Lentinula aciculospora TaxID=153920 RepID=A0A9W9A458_9AGAR|nr:short-chain dehydrogenase [Lentinula aciculospora]